jgi:uncharacterized protein
MKFSLENSAGYSIRSYQAGQVEVVSIAHVQSDQPGAESITLSSSVIITPDRLVENWPPSSSTVLAMEHLDMVLATAPEVIILGTGSRLVFPDQKILQACYQGNVGIEVMDNGAACRTYNVLAAEGRQVAAALII